MRRFDEGEEVDYAIVGIGAGGGVLLQRLASRRFPRRWFRCRAFLGYGARLGQR